MRTLDRLSFYLFAACFVLVMSATSWNAEASDGNSDTVVIGGIMPMSGPMTLVGQTWIRGWELYWEKVNEEGGIKVGDKRYKVKFIPADGKFSAPATLQAAKKLIYKDKAKFIFGEITNPGAYAIQSVTKKAGVLHLLSWVVNPGEKGDVSPQSPMVIRTTISITDTAPIDYDYLREAYPDIRSVAIVGWDNTMPVLEHARKTAEKFGYEVKILESFPPTTLDLVPVFTKVLAHKPDAIYAPNSPTAGYLLKAARSLGFKGVFFSDTPLDPDVILLTSGGPESSVHEFCNGLNVESATEAMEDVVQRWKKKYNEPFVTDAWLAWDGAWILHQVIEKTGTLDGKEIAKAFESLTNPGDLKTLFGPARMAGKKEFGANRVLARPVPITRMDNGKVTFVKFVDSQAK
ncbi:MAG: ABC transporter substrate-binding protein [Nitrospina sp.]|nr:ABC transporter substrate-binding protein [Nitrospina sp.]